MKLQSKLFIAMTLAALGAGGCQRQAPENETASMSAAATDAAAPMAQAGPARYRIELISLWTKADFPLEYPAASLLHKPHFSGLIGTAHNGGYHIFAAGETPSPGLERLSETGKHDPLDAEIQAAVAAGNALGVAESEPLRDFAATATAEVTVDDGHPMVSLVAMIAPSPDWFTGVSEVNLMENGAWVASRTVDAEAWDSGGDDGTTYLADDQDAQPKKPAGPSASPHFMKNGRRLPVARITFTRL